MKKFEYKTTQTKLTDAELNKLGDEGWELITHTAVAVNQFLSGAAFGQYYVFKREKQ